MYFSDESLAEIGFYYDMPDPPETPITEADYYADERAEDERLAFCEHPDTGVELLTNNPNGPMGEVCYVCRTTLRQVQHY